MNFYHLILSLQVYFGKTFERSVIGDKVFKSGLSKFCGREPSKNLLNPLLNTLPHFCSK